MAGMRMMRIYIYMRGSIKQPEEKRLPNDRLAGVVN